MEALDTLLDPLRKDLNSYNLAKETAQLICQLVSKNNFRCVKELIEYILKIKSILKEAYPLEFTIRNIIVQICDQQKIDPFFDSSAFHHIKLKSKTQSVILPHPKFQIQNQEEPFLIENIDMGSQDLEFNQFQEIEIFKNNLVRDLQDQIIDEIDTLSKELEKFIIQFQADKHINSHEIILTFDYSQTIFNFLQKGSQTRKFEVIVVEAQNSKSGAQMAQNIANIDIKVALIPETAVYAVMPRVNKVFISAHAIMNNGGAITKSGAILLAMAAKYFTVPLIIIAAMYKLTPKFPLDQSTFNSLINPNSIYKNKGYINENLISVSVDKYNYIEPDKGEHTPAHTYRMFEQYYGKEEIKKQIKKFKKKDSLQIQHNIMKQ